MEKITSITAFENLQKELCDTVDETIPTIVIPAGTCGQASGANDLIRVIKREIVGRDLSEKIQLRITGCHGFCEMEPSLLIKPADIFYPKVTISDVPHIIDATITQDVYEEHLFRDPDTNLPVAKQSDIPFFNGQTRTILSRSEQFDPIRICQYIQAGGYSAFVKALSSMTPQRVIEEVKNSGLRGRGGAGFPTGVKWELLANRPGNRGKFLVCNADEGDPGAYMDRSLLEGNPHSIIEGMLIGGFATGATEGILYIRDEYPLAIKHVTVALRQLREFGLLGDTILGTEFSFNLNIVRGAGAFVCGEETALIQSIEGKMGEPRQRPPFPAQKGIYGKPTAINNVETWANIPVIFEQGAAKYATTGTPNNAGTKILSLVGKVKYTGLVEVPMGTPLSTIVYDIGGGSGSGAGIKAVQTGGPSGGSIPRKLFNLPVDYDSLAQAGSIMGSGGMIVMDENTCMIDIAKYYMSFLKSESCGKCFTCRKGTQRMYEILNDISEGKGTLNDLALLEELAVVVKDSTMCGLGNTASNPVLSTVRYFRDEYLQHIEKKYCRAGVCKQIVGAPCRNACPVGTDVWRYVAHIQRGEYDEAYRVIGENNPFPSVCARVCNHPCETQCKLGTTGSDPVAIRMLKRFVADRVSRERHRSPGVITAHKTAPKIAIIGAGPAGLTAAYFLAKDGYAVTVFEAEKKPGGMLVCAIPPYRLPRDCIEQEIEYILSHGISLRTNTKPSLEALLNNGYRAVFAAIGAHKSLKLGIKGEDAKGVYTAMEFLKAYNLYGKTIAQGNVGIIGGGNSAIDAARTALRFKKVTGVTVYYRRTEKEMPAYREEIDAAKEEGIAIIPLVTPKQIITKGNRLIGIECLSNKPGETDEYGRKRPTIINGTEQRYDLDTLIVAVGEQPDTAKLSGDRRLSVNKNGTITVDLDTLMTSIEGVFAGGDAVTGPNTVIEAIALGKRAAAVIPRYLNNEPLLKEPEIHLPDCYLERRGEQDGEQEPLPRAGVPLLSLKKRTNSFAEVEGVISEFEARREAGRCLRCDLEFTQNEGHRLAEGGGV